MQRLNGRKNIARVFNAWLKGRPEGGRSLSTDGTFIYSYGTPILGDYMDRPGDRRAMVNVTKYSRTTTTHQNGILEGLRRNFIPWQEVDDIPQGSKPSALYPKPGPSGADYIYDDMAA